MSTVLLWDKCRASRHCPLRLLFSGTKNLSEKILSSAINLLDDGPHHLDGLIGAMRNFAGMRREGGSARRRMIGLLTIVGVQGQFRADGTYGPTPYLHARPG